MSNAVNGLLQKEARKIRSRIFDLKRKLAKEEAILAEIENKITKN
jgi:CII-binding regulator of phage lambda lysogenization HflD